MQDPANETVGEQFQDDILQAAHHKTLEVVLQAARLVRPGMMEKDAKRLIQDIQARMGSTKSFHAPEIRFGENTLLPYGQKGQEDLVLRENDIFFFDIGAVFDEHEGDIGRPFVVGNDPEMIRCCRDAEEIWHLVRDHWNSTGASGGKLYEFAKTCADARGWILSLQKAGGHRIADFPHAVHMRQCLEKLEQKPVPNRWILEIQIRHQNRPFGAFYEDLLN